MHGDGVGEAVVGVDGFDAPDLPVIRRCRVAVNVAEIDEALEILVQHVGTKAAVDPPDASVANMTGVSARRALERVNADTAVEHIVAEAADEDLVGGSSG